MTSERIWMPLYIADYRLDTGHLSAEQHGAYLLLIMQYWIAGRLPNDDDQLARLACMPLDQWLLNRPVIQGFFHSGWKHKRLDIELARANDLIAKKRRAGTKGGVISSMKRSRKTTLKSI